MAAHSLSIAKASLLASCLRPDPNKLNRDDLAHFHIALENSISRCTPSNIQTTKAWLLEHVLPSAARTAAFSKYLASLSKNIDYLPNENRQARSCRRQLHLLYLLNDIFHHVKYHTKDERLRKHLHEHIPSSLPDLFARAAEEKKVGTSRRLRTLLDIWEQEKYCEPTQISSLRGTLSTGKAVDSKADLSLQSRTAKEAPWILPPTHGDPSAPYFDLPAANLMPHIVPNSSRPMRTDKIRALQLPAGPADESLVNAVKDFLKDVKSIDDPFATLEDEGIVADIDGMGQVSYRNEADDVVGDTYYGWSRAFCENMKNRGNHSRNNGKGRLRNSERSRSRSESPRKRRRYTRSRSRSTSPYHEESPPRFASKAQRRRSSPSKTSSRSFSPNPTRFPSASQGQHHPAPPPRPTHPVSVSPGQSPAFQQGSPPPRPPNWQGPWPPPPPPPPSNFPNNFAGMPLPPPPLPPSQNHGGQGYRRR